MTFIVGSNNPIIVEMMQDTHKKPIYVLWYMNTYIYIKTLM